MENSVIKALTGMLAWMIFSACLFDGSETFTVSVPQPYEATVVLGANASFKVTASCAGACGEVLYQWRRNGVDLVDGKTVPGSLIAGAQDAELQISDVHYQDAGSYSCFVRHPPSDSLVSSVAILNVIPPP
jgi:hypothetical protein